MPFVFDIQNSIILVATLGLFALQAWAFIDALTHSEQEFHAADKQSKKFWLIILGVALAAHMLIWHPIHLLNLVGAVAALVYLVDVRPALRSLMRR